MGAIYISVQDFLYKNTSIVGTDVPVPGEDDLVPVHSRDETDDFFFNTYIWIQLNYKYWYKFYDIVQINYHLA